MPTMYFAVGDRVRLCVLTPFARVGEVGTIRRVFASIYDLYDVQFDDLIGTRLIYGREMRPAVVGQHIADRIMEAAPPPGAKQSAPPQ